MEASALATKLLPSSGCQILSNFSQEVCQASPNPPRHNPAQRAMGKHLISDENLSSEKPHNLTCTALDECKAVLCNHTRARDLAGMQPCRKYNTGYKYIFIIVAYIVSVIDVFSKYGTSWIVPLKNKAGETATNALQEVVKIGEKLRIVGLIKEVRELVNVIVHSTEKEEKSSLVERWNKTMKARMFKYFTPYNTNVYVDVLDDLVNQYNNKRHSSINITPVEASEKVNEAAAFGNRYWDKATGAQKRKFKLGDFVRDTEKEMCFREGVYAKMVLGGIYSCRVVIYGSS